MNDAEIFIGRIACFLIPIRYDEQRPSPYKDTGLCSLWETKSKMITINYITGNIVHYTPFLSLGAGYYGVVPLKSALTFKYPPTSKKSWICSSKKSFQELGKKPRFVLGE